MGRTLDTGAPLTGERETDIPDLSAQESGRPVIADNAHIRLAKASAKTEIMLRRGFNFQGVSDSQDQPEMGLLFAAYQRDPRTAFTPVQARLDQFDALNTWVSHRGSAVFVILPGVRPGEIFGQRWLSTSTGSA